MSEGARWILICVAATAAIFVPYLHGHSPAHYVTCIDSDRPGCPAWNFGNRPPCADHGGTRSATSAFLNGTTYVCNDGTADHE